ncbi:MAG: ADP-forming succinate--CoA ligase subunit beta [Bacteroides sp.]|nr:MAG: ADP-forming succinate--CoA ligase subunit beta [Bacteroides sp.]
MNLHEYQAKNILKQFKIPVQKGFIINDIKHISDEFDKFTKNNNINYYVVKAQIHSGGRGKAGGIKLAKSYEDIVKYAKKILGSYLVTKQTDHEGKKVNKILISEDIYWNSTFIQECYISITLDREKESNVIIYSPEGGMEIEEIANKYPNQIHKINIDPQIGITDFHARKIASNLNTPKYLLKDTINLIKQLYYAYNTIDANLIEINPLLFTSHGVYAVDAKITLDDNALYRHKEYVSLRDIEEENKNEIEARINYLNYIQLNGNVGCMINGAGLAMATMDMIKLSGHNPANFLDIGGSANSLKVRKALEIISRDDNVKVILINIFGGIVRCDEVSKGIIDAYNNNFIKKEISIVIRMQGTNSSIAKSIIKESNVNQLCHFTNDLKSAIKMVNTILS